MRSTNPVVALPLLAGAALLAPLAADAFLAPSSSSSLLLPHSSPPSSLKPFRRDPMSSSRRRNNVNAATATVVQQMSSLPPGIENLPTELPDSLEDAAAIAANSCHQLSVTSGTTVRCRVDFDTSIGDETYTTLKSSTEFMQNYVSALCLASVDGVREWKMDAAMKLAQARADLGELRERMQELGLTEDVDDDLDGFGAYPDGSEESKEDGAAAEDSQSEEATKLAAQEATLLSIIANEGADPSSPWTGPKVRIYFPDEGSAALARRDWSSAVPPCVELSSCGGVQVADTSDDAIIIFYCPRASEAESVEAILYAAEADRGEGLKMAVMVNPLLVDMGVTGFGMAGRRLRERLIDGLVPAYYLRTLYWGALTRVWPQLFTVWQEDGEAEGGYRMIKAMDQLPSNPEVEDIYDIENGNMNEPQEGFGLLNALGDFVNGMTKL